LLRLRGPNHPAASWSNGAVGVRQRVARRSAIDRSRALAMRWCTDVGTLDSCMSALPTARVLQIDVTGRDRAGVTHALTGILAASGARILDIGQAVIHGSLALGLLV